MSRGCKVDRMNKAGKMNKDEEKKADKMNGMEKVGKMNGMEKGGQDERDGKEVRRRWKRRTDAG